MMLSALAILIGGTMIWRGRVAAVSDAAGLRRASAAVNRQALTFAVTLLTGALPALRFVSDVWVVAALALFGIFALVLYCMRARWNSRLRTAWEIRVQQSIRRTMLPPATVHVMPASPIHLREAA